jgi:outer membrane murein-binding lipoprotein Lpp
MGLKRLFLAICVAVLAGCASQTKLSEVTSAASVAISLGQWIFKKDKEVFAVQVQARASSREGAERELFRRAVREAFGALVLEQRLIESGELVQDELYIYSAGYVEDYDITNVTRVDGLYEITATVWVSKSRLADRLTFSKLASGRVDGQTLSQKYRTYLEQAQLSDRILESFLVDFPEKTFRVHQGKVLSRIEERKLKIIVPFGLSWDYEYIRALKEVLIRTRESSDRWSESKERNRRKQAPSIIAIRELREWGKTYAGYPDKEKEKLFYKYFIDSEPRLLVSLRAAGNEVLYQKCHLLDVMRGSFNGERQYHPRAKDPERPNGQFFAVNVPGADFGIYGDFYFEASYVLTLGENIVGIDRIDSVDMRVVRKSSCPKS